MPSLFKEIFQQVFRRFVKDRGRFPTPAERDALQDIALKESRKQAEMMDPVFKGVDKMDPDKPFRGFKPKVVPKEGELSVTIEGQTKNMTPEGIMNFLMGKGKAKVETEAEMLARMKKQNKESVERLKKKKEKDREDFSIGGGAGLPAVSGGAMVFDDTGMLMDPMFMLSSPKTGIMSMEEGGPVDPDRRTFVKILGGLASIPILGKFVTPLKQAAPVVAETAKEVPAYFFKLVDKIRRLGDDAPGLTEIERTTGKRYKNYEMVEDQTTGDIVIKKQKQGSTMVGDDMVEGTMSEEVLAYRTPKNTPEGRVPADYEEITVRPDAEGKMKDIEDGLDSMSEILEEVGEAQLKKAGGGLAYMLGE